MQKLYRNDSCCSQKMITNRAKDVNALNMKLNYAISKTKFNKMDI